MMKILDFGFWIFDCGIANLKSKIQNSSGFTLIELLMAATLFSILMIGVVAQMGGGVLAWRRTTSAVDAMQQVRVAADHMTRDLANAVALEPRSDDAPRTEFSRDTMQFYTVWPSTNRIWMVRYQVVEDGDSSRLVRAAGPARDAQTGALAQPEPLLNGAATVSLRYASLSAGLGDHLVWQDQWTDPGQLPRLVELTMNAQGRLNSQPIRWVIEIPSGHLRGSNG